MISIDRLEEMTIEELETKLNNWKEQVELQSNFIDSLLKATNNSEWLDKSILDDEASEIIEKIELDYSELDQLKAENKHLNDLLNQALKDYEKTRETLTKIKEIAENAYCLTNGTNKDMAQFAKQILQKISEVENG